LLSNIEKYKESGMPVITVPEEPQVLNSAGVLAAHNYLRERRSPGLCDLSCLILQDIQNLIRRTAPKMDGKLLDYGCGGAPYKDLFANCLGYVGADMLAGPDVDVVLTQEGMLGGRPNEYDGILSAQVLEHVPDPDAYIEECSRVLKTGGLILLTTHGMFPEHKCPCDYYRWTAEGLERLMQSYGFEVLETTKITCGVRGGIQLLHYIVEQFRHHPSSPLKPILKVFRKLYMVLLLPLLNAIGNWCFNNCATLPGNNPEHLYIALGVFACKR
jgi:SAM-dependent methyltransferase